MSMPTIVCFGDLWVNKVIVGFLQQLDLKNKNKRYNYTDSALVGIKMLILKQKTCVFFQSNQPE